VNTANQKREPGVEKTRRSTAIYWEVW